MHSSVTLSTFIFCSHHHHPSLELFILQNCTFSYAWWYIPIVPATWKAEAVDLELEVSFGKKEVGHCLKNQRARGMAVEHLSNMHMHRVQSSVPPRNKLHLHTH
jgi:hypothetical protein